MNNTPSIEGTAVQYIDITPTWRGQMSVCITILMDRDADYEAKQTAASRSIGSPTQSTSTRGVSRHEDRQRHRVHRARLHHRGGDEHRRGSEVRLGWAGRWPVRVREVMAGSEPPRR